MVGVLVVVPVAAPGLARPAQVRRVAVHQLRTVEREVVFSDNQDESATSHPD